MLLIGEYVANMETLTRLFGFEELWYKLFEPVTITTAKVRTNWCNVTNYEHNERYLILNSNSDFIYCFVLFRYVLLSSTTNLCYIAHVHIHSAHYFNHFSSRQRVMMEQKQLKIVPSGKVYRQKFEAEVGLSQL